MIEAFLKCFTREGEDGKRVNCGEWCSRPDLRRSTQCNPKTSSAGLGPVSATTTATRRQTRANTSATNVESTPTSHGAQHNLREAGFALWDAHVEKYASTISVVQVHQSLRAQNGEIFNAAIKGGRPPTITASLIGIFTTTTL